MKHSFFVLFLLVVANLEGTGNDCFGYISYSAPNIGDDIQSIAAKRFLPRDSIPIDREYIGVFRHDSPVYVIMNGWYMHTKEFAWYLPVPPPEKSWPPSSAIRPLLISMHITDGFNSYAFTDEGITYFKTHGPVGARDLHTLQELQKRDIPSYFSGCLTLTLENDASERQNIIYAVDIDAECVEYIRARSDCPVEVLSHNIGQEIVGDLEKRHLFAEAILNKYKRAKCVITSKFHASMPCLAYETPVLLINTQYDQYRFDGIRELLRNCSREDFLAGNVDFNFNTPGSNPQEYLSLRKTLIGDVTSWLQARR